MKKYDNIHVLPTAKAKKAVILARVSSREQEEGYSIDAQKHRLETYCARRDLTPVKTFAIVESSTSGDRKQFMEMVRFIKAQRVPVALVADKVDRVQRSFKEYPLLDELIQKGKLELHFNTENYIIHKDSVYQERLMWSMGVLMAQSYIDSMRDNVKRSIDQKIRMGEWIAKAPLGYVNIRNERGRGDITVDEQRAPLVKRLFETYATGAYTLSEMVEKTKEWGLYGTKGRPLNRSYTHALLQNPFYYGFMKIKGHIYEHRYDRLINKELFDQCQDVMKSWHKKPFQYAGKEFVFRGLLQCAVSGKTVTADTKTKTYKSGKQAEWTYLRCWNPGNPSKIMWVREEVILEQVGAVLQRLVIPSHIMDDLREYLRNTDQSERAFLRRQIAEWQREYTLCQNRLDRLVDLLLDGTIDRADFEAQKLRLRQQQIRLENNIENARVGDDAFKETMLNLLEIATRAHDHFQCSSTEQKRKLVNFVFANLQLKGTTLCYTLKKPFDQMLNLTTCQQWRDLVDSLRTDSDIRLMGKLPLPFLNDN